MNSLYTLLVLAAVFCVAVLAYFAFRIWRRRGTRGAEGAGSGFQPTVGFTRMDGFASLALLLDNKCDRSVWAEEIEVVLSDLAANDQTAEASCHEIQKIHQNVRPDDMLPISLMGTIYKAAGKPQRKYSCLMSAIVRYRVGEEWFEKPMPPRRLKLAGLTLVSDRRERWANSEFKSADKPRDSQMAGAKSK